MSILEKKIEVMPPQVKTEGEYMLQLKGFKTNKPEYEHYKDTLQETLVLEFKVYGHNLTHRETMSTRTFYKDYDFAWYKKYTPTVAQLEEIGMTKDEFDALDTDSKKELVFVYPESETEKHLMHRWTHKRIPTGDDHVLTEKIGRFLGHFLDGNHEDRTLKQLCQIAVTQAHVVACDLGYSDNGYFEILKYKGKINTKD